MSVTFDHTGTVLKLSETLGQWRERWLGLVKARRVLMYFKSAAAFAQHSEGATDPSLIGGQIALANAWVYVARYTGKDHCFELNTLGKTYFLSAASEDEMRKWVFALAEAGVVIKTPSRPAKGSPAEAAGGDLPFDRAYGMQGFLRKRGALNPSFKRRFFRTMENAAGKKILAYYGSFQDPAPKGVISLEQAEVKEEVSGTTSDAGDFCVQSGPRLFVLRAEDASEKRRWVRVLLALVDGSADKMFVVPPDERMDSLYRILKVKVDATDEEIARQYRRLAKVLHPDRNRASDAKEQFNTLNKAYELLCSEEERDAYDEHMLSQAADEDTRKRLRDAIERRKKVVTRARVASRAAAGDAAPAAAAAAAAPAAAPAAEPAAAAAAGGAASSAGAEDDESRRDRTWSSMASVTIGPAGQEQDAFLRDPRNLCDRCRRNVKAMFCIECGVDVCISCSALLHDTDEKTLHKRIPIERKTDFLAKAAVEGTKENRQMKRHKAEASAQLDAIRKRKAEEEERRKKAEQEAEEERVRLEEEERKEEEAEMASAAAAAAGAGAETSGGAESGGGGGGSGGGGDGTRSLMLLDKDGRPVEPSPNAASEAAAAEEAEEERRRAEMAASSQRRQTAVELELDGDLQRLTAGVNLVKVPRRGKAKRCVCRLSKREADGKWIFSWDSSKKNKGDAEVALGECSLSLGQDTDLFRKSAAKDADLGSRSALSFSLVTPNRTVDLVALNRSDYESWTRALSRLRADE